MRTDRAGQSALLFLDAAEILAAEDVSYLIIGAFALSFHGSVRGSTDVDALLNVPFSRLARLSKSFEAAKFSVAIRRGDDEDPILSMLILSDDYGNRVELLGGLRGQDPGAFSRAIDVPFHGVNLHVVGLEDFISMKCFAGSTQDLADARAAIDASIGPLNVDLLRAVTRRFGRLAADRLEELL
jgi:hypothetical protein